MWAYGPHVRGCVGTAAEHARNCMHRDRTNKRSRFYTRIKPTLSLSGLVFGVVFLQVHRRNNDINKGAGNNT
jgi:hypothetical protein